MTTLTVTILASIWLFMVINQNMKTRINAKPIFLK
jgi:hypothetical protein